MTGHHHHVVASVVSGATTIFNASLEPRFVDLRATRKDQSKAFDTFVLCRRECAAAVSTAAAMDEEPYLELESEMIDSDMDRVFYAMNLNNWIHGAQDVLDPNNAYDREMLTNIASYVEKRRHQFAANSFF